MDRLCDQWGPRPAQCLRGSHSRRDGTPDQFPGEYQRQLDSLQSGWQVSIYETGQRTETPEMARIDLTPARARFRRRSFDDLFKPDARPEGGRGRGGAGGAEAKPPVKPVEIDFNGIKERISMLPIGLSVNQPQISPDGKSLLFSANVGGQVNLYLYPLDAAGSGRGGRGGRGGGDGESRGPRQLTSTPGQKNHAHFTSDSKGVFYLEAGRVETITVEDHKTRAVSVNAEMDVDFNVEKMAVFEEAWAGQRDNYYDPKYHGADWNAVRKMYAPLIEGAQTPDEMRAILRLMIGELNSSHSGISAPPSPGGRGGTVGQLGLSFDRAAYESSGKLKITEVVPHSPAALAKIQPGEELRAVDGVAVGPRVNLDSLLEHKTDKRVVLDVGAGSGRCSRWRRLPTRFIVNGWKTIVPMSRRSATESWATSTFAICRSRRSRSFIWISTPRIAPAMAW